MEASGNQLVGNPDRLLIRMGHGGGVYYDIARSSYGFIWTSLISFFAVGTNLFLEKCARFVFVKEAEREQNIWGYVMYRGYFCEFVWSLYCGADWIAVDHGYYNWRIEECLWKNRKDL